MRRRVARQTIANISDLSDYHTASILKAEVKATQAGSKKQTATFALLLTTCLAYSSTYRIQQHYASKDSIFLISVSFVGWL
jgi:hypothetical protein